MRQLIAFVFCALLISSACEKEKFYEITSNRSSTLGSREAQIHEPYACVFMTPPKKAKQYLNAGRMPLFQSCTNTTADYQAQRKCSNLALLEFIATHLKHPVYPKLYGTCVVGFEVDESGNLSQFELLRDIGTGYGEEAMRIAQLLPNDWIPATRQGKPIKARFALPIRFRAIR